MFKFILLGIYILSVIIFAFIEISIARAALRHAKKIMKRGCTIRPTPVSLLRVVLIGLIPVINTVFASILLFCYERFEDDAIQTVNNLLIKEGA